MSREGQLPAPNSALAELLQRDGELDRILSGRGLTFHQTPQPTVQPPQPFRPPPPDWDQERREREELERQRQQEERREILEQELERLAGEDEELPRREEAKVANMTITAVGVLLSADGIASRKEIGDDWRSRTIAWANPASQLRRHHQTPLRVTCEHDGEAIGQIVGVHQTPGRGGRVALAVAELDGDGADRLLEFPDPLFFSAETDAAVTAGSVTGRDIKLLGAALTVSPARLLARLEPLSLFPGSLRERSRWSIKGIEKTVVDETISQHRHRGDGRVLYITNWRDPDDDLAYNVRNSADRPGYWRQTGPIEHSAHRGQVLRVH